jgi:hypothetical protein
VSSSTPMRTASRLCSSSRRRRLTIIVMGALLAGCSGSGSDDSGNASLSIGGTPPPSVLIDYDFDFTPSASSANGGGLEFSVANLPGWASFDPATGRITGTPDEADLGRYSNIVISVSDGESTASLQSFSIDVVATAPGAVSLGWLAPSENTDGSPLVDLSGVTIYWGHSATNLKYSATIENPSLTTYVVENLTPATWYFAATVFNSQGIESPRSNVVNKHIPR